MSTDDEKWLRSGLATAFPDTPPPPDLSARAERTATRIRRRRTAVVVAGVVLALAVPLTAVGLTDPDRALPPAAPLDPGAACEPPGTVLPQQPLARPEDDPAVWGYRGDPALRETAAEVGRLHNGAPSTPLYAARVGPEERLLVVYTARVLTELPEWHVFAVWAPEGPGGAIEDTAIGRLPLLRPDSAVNLLLPTSPLPAPTAGSPAGPHFRTNTLIVLAPPGSSRVDYVGCRDGATFEETASGDTLVRDVGTLDAPGLVGVRTADGAAGYTGPAADLAWPDGVPVVMLPPADPIPVPAGTREVYRGSVQGHPMVHLGGPAEPVRNATVLVRCRVGVPVEVTLDGSRIGTVTADGAVHTAVEGFDLDGQLEVRAVEQLAGEQERTPVACQLAVVVPT